MLTKASPQSVLKSDEGGIIPSTGCRSSAHCKHSRMELNHNHPTTAISGGTAKGHAPHCPPKTAVSTPLHAPLSTRLDEISCLRVPQSKPVFGPFGPPGRPRGPLPPRHCPKIAGAGGADPPLRPPPAPLRGTWAGLCPAQSPREGV
jgi:hypothetical protein